MSKLVDEKTELKKTENGYEYYSHGRFELSEEDFEKNVNNFLRNVIVIEDYIAKFDLIKKDRLDAKTKQLNTELQAAKDAYEDYDNIVKKLIDDITDKKEEKRNIIKQYIDNFEEKLKNDLQKVEELLEKEKSGLERQLNMDKPMLVLYEQANKERLEQIKNDVKKELEEKQKELEEKQKVSSDVQKEL